MDNEDRGGDGGEDDDGWIGEEDDGDVGLVGVGQVAERRRAPFQSGWAVCAAMVVVGFGPSSGLVAVAPAAQAELCCPTICESSKSRTAVKPLSSTSTDQGLYCS